MCVCVCVYMYSARAIEQSNICSTFLTIHSGYCPKIAARMVIVAINQSS